MKIIERIIEMKKKLLILHMKEMQEKISLKKK